MDDGLVEAVVEMLKDEDEATRELEAWVFPRTHHAFAVHGSLERSL